MPVVDEETRVSRSQCMSICSVLYAEEKQAAAKKVSQQTASFTDFRP